MKDTLVGVVLVFVLGALLCSAMSWADADSASMKMCEETEMLCLLDDEHKHAPIIFQKANTLSHPKHEPCLGGAALMDENNLSFVCEHKKWRHYQNACEIKMEAAMRAMEPYLPGDGVPRPTSVNSVYRECNIVCEAEKDLERAKAIIAALKQWRDVSHKCWRPDR